MAVEGKVLSSSRVCSLPWFCSLLAGLVPKASILLKSSDGSSHISSPVRVKWDDEVHAKGLLCFNSGDTVLNKYLLLHVLLLLLS